MLKGNRIQLRPVRKSDVTDTEVVKWLDDPETTILANGYYVPRTIMAEEKWIEELTTMKVTSNVELVIESVEGNEAKAIGIIELDGIEPKDYCAGFGITIGDKDYWNKGYGTEAANLIIKYGFEQLNLHRISSNAFSFNERSIRMHKKLGFREEGRQREINFANGQYHDLVLFGILKEEWQKNAEGE